MATGLITTAMTDPAALIRILAWFSPAFPIGGFSFSQGMETGISSGDLTRPGAIYDWLSGQLHAGPIRTDAYFLAIAAHATGSGDPGLLAEARDLALALQGSAERLTESTEQARSFYAATQAWPCQIPPLIAEVLDGPMTYPIAVGTLAGLHGLAPDASLAAFLTGWASQQISVAIRLVPLGQSEGLALLARLEPAISALVADAAAATLDDIAGIGYGTDIASQRHEDLHVRIFRS